MTGSLAKQALAKRALAPAAIATAFLTVHLVACPRAAQAQAMGEYGRAGTHIDKSSPAPAPHVPKATAVPKAAPAGVKTTEGAHLIQAKHTGESEHDSHAQGPPLWSEAWFSNRGLVREQVRSMVGAITASMVGESYPLSRGGGFRCTQPSGAGAGGASSWAMRCTGLEIGGQRENDFNVITPGAAPVLERVRWLVVAPASSRGEQWHNFYSELTDSLTRAMGQPSWTAADHSSVRWSWNGAETTALIHGGTAHVESLEITCLSNRLAETRRSAAP